MLASPLPRTSIGKISKLCTIASRRFSANVSKMPSSRITNSHSGKWTDLNQSSPRSGLPLAPKAQLLVKIIKKIRVSDNPNVKWQKRRRWNYECNKKDRMVEGKVPPPETPTSKSKWSSPVSSSSADHLCLCRPRPKRIECLSNKCQRKAFTTLHQNSQELSSTLQNRWAFQSPLDR